MIAPLEMLRSRSSCLVTSSKVSESALMLHVEGLQETYPNDVFEVGRSDDISGVVCQYHCQFSTCCEFWIEINPGYLVDGAGLAIILQIAKDGSVLEAIFGPRNDPGVVRRADFIDAAWYDVS